MEARLATVAEMEEKGYWECEDGHEESAESESEGHMVNCHQCGKPAKFIKRSAMSGKEQYQSDKDRKKVEKILAGKREQLAGLEEDLKNQESTANYFRGQANSARTLAEALRKV